MTKCQSEIMKNVTFNALLLTIVLLLIGATFTVILSYFIKPSLFWHKDLIQLISLSAGLLSVLIITKSTSLLWQFFRKAGDIKPYHLYLLLFFIAINLLLHYLTNDSSNTAAGTTKIRLLQMFLIIPVLEELVFRGVFQSRITKSYNWRVGVLVSSLLFMFIHYGELDYMLFCFIFSVFAGYLYYKTDSLLLCVMYHIAVNIGIFLLNN